MSQAHIGPIDQYSKSPGPLATYVLVVLIVAVIWMIQPERDTTCLLYMISECSDSLRLSEQTQHTHTHSSQSTQYWCQHPTKILESGSSERQAQRHRSVCVYVCLCVGVGELCR